MGKHGPQAHCRCHQAPRSFRPRHRLSRRLKLISSQLKMQIWSGVLIMSDERNPPLQSLPVANYSSAIARAVEWLGDRYLLATPLNATHSRGAGQKDRRETQASIATIDVAG